MLKRLVVKPFFTDEELSSVYKNESQDSNCLECGLYKNCNSPKMPVTGQGRLKILGIAEAPGEIEDEQNKQLVGKVGQFFRSRLEDKGIDLDRDLWKTNSIICRPPNNRAPRNTELNLCKKNYLDFIEENKPKFIWLIGAAAIKSYYMSRFSDEEGTVLTPSRWRGLCIPDAYSKAWVIPMFHPSYPMRNENDSLTQSQYNRDLDFAISCLTKKPPEFYNPYNKVKILTKFDDVIDLLTFLIKHPPEYLVFDYETTGLKPYDKGHKIACVSVAYKEDEAYSFPIQYPHFTVEQQDKIIRLWGQVLKNKSKKSAHGLKFEDVWSRVIVNVAPENWHWCSMNACHILDNRTSFSSLKFQAFIRWGVEQYDKKIRKYLKSKKSEKFNQVMSAPLKELLLYCGIDSLLEYKLLFEQKKEMTPSLKKANDLFIDGLLVLSDIQINGICVNRNYYEKQDKLLENEKKRITASLLASEDAKLFNEKVGREIKLSSDDDLRKLFFEIQKLPIIKLTDTKKPCVDIEVMHKINSPIASSLVELSKLDKIKGTYIGQILRETNDDGRLHPFFDLHKAQTFRSCIAQGTLVYVVKDFINHPKGIPIETVKEGDYVYCFDNELKPTIRKVVWSGKTGHEKVIRIHWKGGRGNYGYLDVTPKHLIRLINGKYVEARDLCNDWRESQVSKHSPKSRVLSLHRKRDKLYFTGHIKNGVGLLEHRFIYKQLIGNLKDSEVIHHKDCNHLNHTPSNLEKKTNSDHARLHCVFTDAKVRENNKASVKSSWACGNHANAVRRGVDHHSYLDLTKWQCLRFLARNKGCYSKNNVYDFSTFKKYLQKHGINPKIVKLRYDKYGKYISKKRFCEVTKHGLENARKQFGHNYYRLKKLYEFYGVDYKRKWRNQFGQFESGNHVIIRLEELDKAVDVYDIEVEEFNNFFANEICVHNSSSNPNFQNIPIRDPLAKEYTRSGIYPSPGNLILDWDYSSLEVRIIACYTQDPVLIDYINTPGADPHRDQASELFRLDPSRVHKDLRFYAKNGWVFPQFYGSWYKNCAKAIWQACIDHKLHTTDGDDIFNHLVTAKVIKHREDFDSFEDHLKICEDKFWSRFKATKKWQERSWAFYERHGYIQLLTGFKCQGYMTRNDIVNYPVQGAAFHCLLYSLINCNNEMFDRKIDSALMGQIHDCALIDCVPKEKKDIKELSVEIATQRIREEWKWIIVPLDIEFEETGVDKSWYTKKEMRGD